jgi:AcrR family transcriptional regulator
MMARTTKGAILTAAARILERDGYPKLTMERVSSESGVAKTTLYHHWPTKAALCMDLYLEVESGELHDKPDTGNLANDLKYLTNLTAHLLTGTVAGPAWCGLIAEAQTNPETRGAFAEFVRRRREITRRVLDRAIARGELRADTDVELVMDAVGGAIAFRLLQGHAPISRRFTDAIIDLVLFGCRDASGALALNALELEKIGKR